MCDNCAYETVLKEVDATHHAKVVVSLLREMQENDQRATMLQLLDKVKIKKKELGGSSSPLPDLKKEELEHLIVQLILDRFLKEEFQHTAYSTNAYVTVGPLWKQVLQGKTTVTLELGTRQICKASNVKASKAKKHTVSSGLETKLDELRKELASSHGEIFPHAVLSTQQISILSTQKPISLEQLEKLIGKLKTEKYGCRIVDQIQKYTESEQPHSGTRDEVEGSEKRVSQRLKTKRAFVLIESSGEDSE